MRKWRAFALLIIGAQIPKLLSALPNEAPLQVGSGFPRFSGQTLTGKSLDLPAAAAGRPVVVVFSFSKSAGQDAHKWNENLSRDFPNVPAYTLIELQSVPKLFRGMALAGIKSMPVSMQDRTVVLYQNEDLWKERLAVSDETRAYVVLLGPGGHIRWRNRGRFAEFEYAALRGVLATLFQPRP
jgi:hypothetical protein